MPTIIIILRQQLQQVKQDREYKKREQKANEQQNREGCYDAFWKIQGKGKRKMGGNIKMEELKGTFLNASRIGAIYEVAKKLGGDR